MPYGFTTTLHQAGCMPNGCFAMTDPHISPLTHSWCETCGRMTQQVKVYKHRQCSTGNGGTAQIVVTQCLLCIVCWTTKSL